jgi:hypothetical protein
VLQAASERVTALLRASPDASLPIPHSEWSVVETPWLALRFRRFFRQV